MAGEMILVVEDDESLSFIIKRILESKGYRIMTADSVSAAREIMISNSFDLILLDMMLPDGMGTEICEEIRQSSFCPILFISCLNDSETKVGALKLGGDDYIAKPIDFEELVARIESNLRRTKQYGLGRSVSSEAKYPGMTVNKKRHEVWLTDESGEPVEEAKLSPTEYKLLETFMDKAGELLLYHELYSTVWESDDLGDPSTVMVHVSNLRKKLGEAGRTLFKTVRGAGYIFGTIE